MIKLSPDQETYYNVIRNIKLKRRRAELTSIGAGIEVCGTSYVYETTMKLIYFAAAVLAVGGFPKF